MNLRIAGAILRKDVLCLLPLVMLTATLFAADVFVTRLDLVPLWAAFRDPVLQLAFAVLVMSLFQLDSPASFVDDWLCRPVPPAALLAAKCALLVLVAYATRAVAILVCDLAAGASPAEAIQDALLLQDFWLAFATPVLLMIGMVTRTLVQGFGVLIAIFLCVFVIPTPVVREPGPLEPAIGEALLRVGMDWLAFAPAMLAAVCLLILGAWFVYWRRWLRAARVLLAVMVAALLLLTLLPMWLAPFPSVFAAQVAAGPRATEAAAASIYLRNPRACLPAARVENIAADPQFAAAREAAGLAPWSADQIEKAGPRAMAFLTTIEPRRLPLDWRVRLNYVQADYLAGDGRASSYSLRPAMYSTDAAGGSLLAHAWMLPDAALRELQAAPEVDLRLRYFLTLLEPHAFELPTDGKRHALPGLGVCRAGPDADGSHVDVHCFSPFGRSAQISAELERIPATRVYGPLDLAPRWARGFQGEHVRLSIASPRLAKHDRITVTAWTTGGHVEESLLVPGLLGGDAAACPVPTEETRSFQKAVWRDAAPHEVSKIGVADGVQLEVLDFGGTGSPILLLPGLGATAHSFDEFAPLLAQRHRVIAMTRRGAGYSSKPDYGYDTARLSQDVLQVMDALGLSRVALIGHSIAGDELTWLGGQHPERFRALVYLDAAYDRSGDASVNPLRELNQRLPPEPPLPMASLVNYAALSRLLAERGHVPLPEGELIAFLNVDKPFVAGTPAIAPRIQQAIVAHLTAPDYAAVKVPALAIYAIEDPQKPLPPWYDREDAGLAATVDEIARIRVAKQRADIETFRHGMRVGEVIELPGATHYVMQSNAAEVLAAIEQFLARH